MLPHLFVAVLRNLKMSKKTITFVWTQTYSTTQVIFALKKKKKKKKGRERFAGRTVFTHGIVARTAPSVKHHTSSYPCHAELCW